MDWIDRLMLVGIFIVQLTTIGFVFKGFLDVYTTQLVQCEIIDEVISILLKNHRTSKDIEQRLRAIKESIGYPSVK